MAESDSGQASSSSYADWWRYYCQYAQHAQAAQAQQTQGQASTYSTTTTPTTTEHETYQVNYSTYPTSSYTQAPSTTTAATSYKEPPAKDDYYTHSYGYYSAASNPVENTSRTHQDSSVNYPTESAGSYANDNAQNAQLENLQKLVAQSVAEAVLKECSDNMNVSQQPQPMGGMMDKIPPDMDYDRGRYREGSWRGRGGRGRGKNGHSHFDNRHQRDFHSNDDGYWNKRKFNEGGGGEYRSRRPDFGRGFRPNMHPRDAFRSNRYDGTNHSADTSPIHVPQRPLGPSNPAAVVQQQIEMMMKGGKSKRPRVYAPPPKSLTNQVYNAMKHPIDDRLKSGEAKDVKKDDKETTTNAEIKPEGENNEVPKDAPDDGIPVGYNPETKYGEEYVQEVKAFHCHLCGVLLRWKSEVDEHVRSTQHYRLFKSSEDEEKFLSHSSEGDKEVTKVSGETSEMGKNEQICGEHKETQKQELA